MTLANVAEYTKRYLEPLIGARFLVTAGSVLGREHRRLHRNNQDGVRLHVGPELIVGCVTDGCSAGRSSEVGARLGASWLVGRVARLWNDGPSGVPASLVEQLTADLRGYLTGVAGPLVSDEVPLPRTVQEHFLFTFLVAVIDPDRTTVFGIGDGVVSVNGRVARLTAGPDNAPDYVAYGLLDPAALAPGSSGDAATIHVQLPTSELTTLVIGTDGIGPLADAAAEGSPASPAPQPADRSLLASLEADQRFQRNPSLLHKRLVVLGERPGLLPDDATMVLIKRRHP